MTAQTIYRTDFYALGLVGKLERSAIRLVATLAHQLAKKMRKPRKQDSYSNPVTLIMFLVGPISLYGHIQSVWTWPPYCLMSASTAGVTAVSGRNVVSSTVCCSTVCCSLNYFTSILFALNKNGTSSLLRTSVQPFSSFLSSSVLPPAAATLASVQRPTFVRFLTFLYGLFALLYFSHFAVTSFSYFAVTFFSS